MYKILLIEDDKEIAELVSDFFNRREDTQVSCAYNGEDGEDMIYENDFDLVLLDVMMPGIDGFTVCTDIRASSDVPIIFLTARSQMHDVLYGYSLGCDDYIVKPFSIEELYEVYSLRDFPGGTVAKNLPSDAGDTGSIPGWGTKIPRVVGQLDPHHS